jgi:hypothetical protein
MSCMPHVSMCVRAPCSAGRRLIRTTSDRNPDARPAQPHTHTLTHTHIHTRTPIGARDTSRGVCTTLHKPRSYRQQPCKCAPELHPGFWKRQRWPKIRGTGMSPDTPTCITLSSVRRASMGQWGSTKQMIKLALVPRALLMCRSDIETLPPNGRAPQGCVRKHCPNRMLAQLPPCHPSSRTS